MIFRGIICFVLLCLQLLGWSRGSFIPERSYNYRLNTPGPFSESLPDYVSWDSRMATSSCLRVSSGYDSDQEYSRCLTRNQERKNVMEEGFNLIDERPRWRKVVTKPFKIVRNALIPSRAPQPGNLIMICTGTSSWKKNFTFTGWADPELIDQGVQECEHAARLLLEAGYEPDIVYTSRLKRAIHSVWVILQELDCAYLPVFKSWRLNERMYGALTGLCKQETAEKFGPDVVQAWRRSLNSKPPPVKPSDPYFPGNDRKYFDLTKEQMPVSESLKDCMERTRPLWEYKLTRDLLMGNNVMVVGHSNTLRGLAKIIDDIDDEDIADVRIPKGIPVVYNFNKDMTPVAPKHDALTPQHTSGTFLEKPGLLKEALRRQDEWQQQVPGSRNKLNEKVKRMSSVEESLLKLRQERELERWSQQFVKHVDTPMDAEKDDEGVFEEDIVSANASASDVVANVGKFGNKDDPIVVFIRHGRTPHNQLSLFTGWEDPPLAKDGIEDAKRAGRLLKKHGFEFDVVYSSWLTRAIETAWHTLDELDMSWLPIIKSWRLNERHYGALTGKSKKMVGNIYGEDQLKKWRRGFNIAPPKSSSYSFSYPGNDFKRTKHVEDIRISLSETIFRSLEAKRFQLHRKFPKSESLSMCMARSIPFYTERIVPEAVEKGKRVLITSHENAIRGILMHLCEIPEEHMNELHLPNGLPMIYNVRRRCITLLDEGNGEDLLEKYDFGSAAQYLFRPCELLDEDFLVAEEGSVGKKQILEVS